MTGSGGRVRPWPKLEGLTRGNRYPETCWGGVLYSRSLSGWGKWHINHSGRREVLAVRALGAHGPVATPPAPPRLCIGSLPSRERADGGCHLTCPLHQVPPHTSHLLGSSNQSQLRPPWCQVGTEGLVWFGVPQARAGAQWRPAASTGGDRRAGPELSERRKSHGPVVNTSSAGQAVQAPRGPRAQLPQCLLPPPQPPLALGHACGHL